MRRPEAWWARSAALDITRRTGVVNAAEKARNRMRSSRTESTKVTVRPRRAVRSFCRTHHAPVPGRSRRGLVAVGDLFPHWLRRFTPLVTPEALTASGAASGAATPRDRSSGRGDAGSSFAEGVVRHEDGLFPLSARPDVAYNPRSGVARKGPDHRTGECEGRLPAWSLLDKPPIGRRNWRRVNKVLFVCTANVCRSPMAASVFDAVAADRNLAFRAQSAGTAALEGRPMASNAVAALEEIGVHPGPHRARQVSVDMIDAAGLVLAMGPRHAAALCRLVNEPHKIYVLPQYAQGVPGEVPDPYGHTMFAFRSTLRQLYEYTERVLDQLEG